MGHGSIVPGRLRTHTHTHTLYFFFSMYTIFCSPPPHTLLSFYLLTSCCYTYIYWVFKSAILMLLSSSIGHLMSNLFCTFVEQSSNTRFFCGDHHITPPTNLSVFYFMFHCLPMLSRAYFLYFSIQ